MQQLNREISKVSCRNAMELSRSYNILSTKLDMQKALSTFFTNPNIQQLSKLELHSLFNEIIINNYQGESFIKSLLIKYFSDKDVISAFEIKANNSRLDFLSINGVTCSYEIKSEVDNLNKLKKQVNDYTSLFEYNYVVVGRNHFNQVKEILPSNYGILIANSKGLATKRKAKLNKLINPMSQLSLFTKKELDSSFRSIDYELICQSFTTEFINNKFKMMLKSRYAKRWKFLIERQAQILPIDYQYFFNHNIEPSIIYR